MSQNPVLRLKEHNGLKVKSTKAFAPWIIVMVEEAGEIKKARALEKYYKGASGRQKIKKIIQEN